MGAAKDLDSHGGAPTGEAEHVPTLLLVDDTPVTVEIERAYFASVGFKVLVATTPKAVEETVRSSPVDLVMIDVNFAREQGLATARAARRATCHEGMRILVTSVLSNPQLRKKAKDHGADDILVKPAPRPKVLKEIKRLTSQASRGNERVRQEIDVRCHVGEAVIGATTLDISSDGVHLSARAAGIVPAVGTHLVMEIPLGRNEKPLSLKGTVMRHTEDGFGVRFDDMPKLARRTLDKFLLRFSMEHRASQFYL
jgi:DNA-binding response OmpR family regulator